MIDKDVEKLLLKMHKDWKFDEAFIYVESVEVAMGNQRFLLDVKYFVYQTPKDMEPAVKRDYSVVIYEERLVDSYKLLPMFRNAEEVQNRKAWVHHSEQPHNKRGII